MKMHVKARNFKPSQPLVGNVYAVRGQSGASFWVIVSVCPDNMCCALGITTNGAIIAATRRACHYFEDKAVIGHCEDIEKASFCVTLARE